jgi:hypothetical protein
MNHDERVVAVLDILGYSRLMETYSLDRLEELIVAGLMGTLGTAKLLSGEAIVVGSAGQLYEYADLVEIEYGIISDTIVLYPKPRVPDPLTALCTTVSVLMSDLLSSGLLLRGGIAVDTFRAIKGHPIYLGRALIAAHKIEMGQEWSGCALSPRIRRKFPRESKLLRSKGLIVDYDIPFKSEVSSRERSRLALNWFHFSLGDYVEKAATLRRLLADAPEFAKEKVRSAISFMSFLEKQGLSASAPVSKKLFDRSRVGGTYRFAPRDPDMRQR